MNKFILCIIIFYFGVVLWNLKPCIQKFKKDEKVYSYFYSIKYIKENYTFHYVCGIFLTSTKIVNKQGLADFFDFIKKENKWEDDNKMMVIAFNLIAET